MAPTKKKAAKCLLLGIILTMKNKKINRRKRRVWVKPWLLKKERGLYHNLVLELQLSNFGDYRNFMRMNSETFQELLEYVRPDIQGVTTHLRRPISPEEKLVVTLRFLATGESYQSLMYQFRIHESTISIFVPKVCNAIYNRLCEKYFKMPTEEKEWLYLAEKAQDHWQFPNAFGAADGKHIALYHPANSGSEFFNYKGFYSIVLMALVDYDYKFIYADVGCQGRISDGGVYKNSSFFAQLSSGALNIPQPRPLPSFVDDFGFDDHEEELPYVFVGDNAFPLGENCLKPYSNRNLDDRKRIFNYRLSRFRRVSENAFGILTSVFRIFSTKINLDPDRAVVVVLACLVLHNMLRKKSTECYTPQGFADEVVNDEIVEGEWRNEQSNLSLQNLPSRCSANKSKKNAERVRDIFADYFYGPGQVPWQWKLIV